MSLASLEKTLLDRLLKPVINDDDFLSNLLPLNGLDEEAQLQIYRSNVSGAHQKVLEQVYPACLNILGEDYFLQMCNMYRFDHPSVDTDLNTYGEFFTSFMEDKVKTHDELYDFQYLPDLAWLEWRWHSSYYANNDDVFSFENLSSISLDEQNEIIFSLSDSFSLHCSPYPVIHIWEENKNVTEQKKDIEQAFLSLQENSYFCISRVELFSELEVLEYGEYELLRLIENSATLEVLMEFCISQNKSKFQEQLMRFIQKKWIVGFIHA